MVASGSSSFRPVADNPKRASEYLVQIRDLIYNVAGIFQANNRMHALEDRCQRRMKALGIASLREYHECLTVGSARRHEVASLLDEITVGETYFFRNRPQLDAIRTIVLPQLIEAKSKMGLPRLRIWSAGCSTGEEPLTLAMMLLEESQAHLKGWGVEILATDLNEHSIAAAKAGLYGEHSTRNLEPRYRNKYFTPCGDKLQINPEVLASIRFNRLNLLDESGVLFMKGLDLILCCNVLIYFDVASKKRVLHHFYNNLLPHGYLLMGQSESLFGISEQFRLVHMPSTTAYIKS